MMLACFYLIVRLLEVVANVYIVEDCRLVDKVAKLLD